MWISYKVVCASISLVLPQILRQMFLDFNKGKSIWRSYLSLSFNNFWQIVVKYKVFLYFRFHFKCSFH